MTLRLGERKEIGSLPVMKPLGLRFSVPALVAFDCQIENEEEGPGPRFHSCQTVPDSCLGLKTASLSAGTLTAPGRREGS